jgi:adenine-specific DNA-methyltransferase
MPVNVDMSFLNSLEVMERDDLVKIIKNMATGGIAVMFHGKRSAMEIQKLVRPRAIKVDKNLCYGSKEEQAKNIILEGENLQGMVTLYKYRDTIDLILTDPPYNTGKTFRYNDKWDEDPNDPDLGNVVPLEDGSRHTKWMKVMLPRLQMMKAMLKPSGVLAICIDDSEFVTVHRLYSQIYEIGRYIQAKMHGQTTFEATHYGYVLYATGCKDSPETFMPLIASYSTTALRNRPVKHRLSYR